MSLMRIMSPSSSVEGAAAAADPAVLSRAVLHMKHSARLPKLVVWHSAHSQSEELLTLALLAGWRAAADMMLDEADTGALDVLSRAHLKHC